MDGANSELSRRLLGLLRDIVSGRPIADAEHKKAAIDDMDRLYPSPYFNYFCEAGETFLLVLPEAMRDAPECADETLSKYLWFGANQDPVVRISAARAAELTVTAA